ncbi:MAG: hypothetical protein PF588_08300 [Candidatus Kapabacteria bacterium]|jgi:hypothetical protein|nr:hypothetical protein [Candidatus Kapabacteria bacterium]
MSDIELYKDFVDSKLGDQAEQAFAEKFAYDQNFREGFKSYTAVTNSVRKNISKFGPSSAVTAGIFGSLGYGSAVAATATVSKFAFIKGKLFSSVISAAAASLLTFLIVLNSGSGTELIDTNELQDVTNNQVELKTTTNLEPTSSSSIDKNKEVSSITQANFRSNTAKPIDVNNDNVPVIIDKTEQNNRVSDNFSSESDQSETLIIPVDQIATLSSEPNDINELITPKPDQNEYVQIPKNSQNKPLGLQLEIRSTAAWNLPKETIYPSNIAKFHNMSAMLSYKLSDNWSVGLSIRQETFFAKYKGTDENQRSVTYEQQPNLLSYGVDLRWSSDKIFGFNPYLGTAININSYGPVARGSLGGAYYLYPEFGITCELEYSKLFYQHQNNQFSAEKIGINYGILFYY